MSHSILPPSSAAIWAAPEGCRGWVTMAAGYPDEIESEEAREGTLAHSMAMGLLNYRLHGFPYQMPERLSRVDGIEITTDMLEGARGFAEYVSGIADRSAIIERPVQITCVHEYCHGTPDVVWHDRDANIVHVFDYKFGWGVVEADNNYQCLLYALGACETWGYPMDAKVRVHIIQPRAMHYEGPVRTWRPFLSLINYRDQIRQAAEETMRGDAATRSGQHCRHCTARHVCSAALNAGLAIYESTSVALPVDAPVDAIAARWNLLTLAEKRIKRMKEAYEAQFTSLLQQGERARDFHLAEVRGRAEWIDKPTAIAVAAEGGFDLSRQDIITPTQAKDAGIPAAIIDCLSIRKPGLKIQKIDHKRAEEAFKS